LGATIDYHEPLDLAQKAIPAISPLLLDPVPDVRSQAFKALDISLRKLEKAASLLPEPPAPQQASAMGSATNAGQPGAGNSDWMVWAGSAVAGMSYSVGFKAQWVCANSC